LSDETQTVYGNTKHKKMKTLKYISSVIAATVIALGVVTYIKAEDHKAPQSTVRAGNYFHYKGTSDSPTEIRKPSNWEDNNDGPGTFPCEELSGLVCIVEFDGDLADLQEYLVEEEITQEKLETNEMIRAYQEEL